METEELMGVCASYGIKFNAAKDRKIDLINKIEKARYKGNKEMTLMLEGKKRDGSLLLKDNTDIESSSSNNNNKKRKSCDDEFIPENTPVEKKKVNPVVVDLVDID
jgi:hypothetical protein